MVSGSRAATEMKSRRRAPCVEEIAFMEAMLRLHWCTVKIHF